MADNGVDLSQVHHLLALTPGDRVRYLQAVVASGSKLRRAFVDARRELPPK
jgi:hypothetical protein